MKRSTKAALLSGLVLPGIGHMVLRRYRTGIVLILLTLIAMSVIVNGAFERALVVVDQINSGAIGLESGSISEMISSSATGAEIVKENIAMIVLCVCWLFGIIDAYRIGKTQED